MANKSFLPNSQGKKIMWSKIYSNLLKIRFRKRTHVFDNTMISLRKTFSKGSVIVIKTQNHTTRQNSWSYVTIRELQARKHNQISAITFFCERQESEKTNISWYQNWDILSFLETKSVSKLLTFENNPKVMKFHEKLSRKRWQVINFSPPLFSKFE